MISSRIQRAGFRWSVKFKGNERACDRLNRDRGREDYDNGYDNRDEYKDDRNIALDPSNPVDFSIQNIAVTGRWFFAGMNGMN
ncbi:MAG: hypothetical protein BRC33_03090 [Cyanobacteria bacterium SW_9_44_58]|nr:MAG: hypothetical protein BRC33_03090 [Cyanobacteria bacterium SW_9_44_58]